MISVKDLIKWAEENATGRSPLHPKGWISSQKLMQLAGEIVAEEPLDYYWSIPSNLSEEGTFKYR